MGKSKTTELSLPRNLDAERQVLGSMIVDPDTIPGILRLLEAKDFYDTGHQNVFESIRELHRRGVKPDTTAVADNLDRKGQFNEIGRVDGVTRITRSVATSTNSEHHARMVLRRSAWRRLVDDACWLVSQSQDMLEEPDALATKMAGRLANLQQRLRDQPRLGISELISEAERQIYEPESRATPFPTGILAVDKYLKGGPKREQILVIDGDTSSGKTALMEQIVLYNALRGANAVIFSYEMSALDMSLRAVSHLARLDVVGHAKHYWQENADANDRVVHAIAKLRDLHITLFENRSLTTDGMEHEIQQLTSEGHPPDIIVVDYIQRVPGLPGRDDSRAGEVSRISRTLGEFAGKYDALIIVVSQISNQGREERDLSLTHRGKYHIPRATTRQQKESGDIAGDADVLLSLLTESQAGDADRWRVEIEIAKHRHGRRGLKLECWFYGAGGYFVAQDDPEPPDPLAEAVKTIGHREDTEGDGEDLPF